MYSIVDFLSQEVVTPTSMIYCNGSLPWEIVMDIDRIRSLIHKDYFMKTPPMMSKYFSFLPVDDCSKIISLNEGSTPLLKSKRIGESLGVDLYFKTEYQNPTGSFKDRGSAIEISVAREMKAPAISVASTGNMAASCSCYAASAGIPCFIFVPEDTPASKLAQVISFGGKIVQVKGRYNDAAILAEEVARELGFYLAGDYAFRVEGAKTAAFEVIDQLFYNVPDAVFVPMGCGTNLAGYAKGFKEYYKLGLISKIPRLFGTQAEGAAAIVRAVEKGAKDIEPLSQVSTIASAIAIGNPIDAIKALNGIYASNGSALAVSDREIREAQYLLSEQEGLYVEASSATAIASLFKAVKQGEVFTGSVVCVLTGDGLKDPSTMLKMAIKPPTINPSVAEFSDLYTRGVLSRKSVTFVDNSTILFTESPSAEVVEKGIVEYLDTTLSRDYINPIQSDIGKFLLKGKPVSLADFQDIVQNVLEGASQKDRVLEVIDFQVTTGKDKVPVASVTVSMRGELLSAKGEGVGPVDAVINALKDACSKRLSFHLSNYEVLMRSEGTDAVVYAEMKLERSGVSSIGKGASPDIIQASIEAFERAYNGLLKR
jgi:threonine synthase